MNELAKDAAAIDVTDLLTRYSFELGGSSVERLVNTWLHHYPTQWLRLAVIEALYQGRYKAISVEQILNLWMRRGRSLYRFNHEFERIICGRFPAGSSRSHALNSVRTQPLSKPVPPTPANPSSPPADRPDIASPVAAKAPNPTTEPSVAPPLADEPVEAELLPSSEEPPRSGAASPSFPQRLPVPTFKPNSPADLGILEIGIARSLHREPIHQFTPTSESSDFYSKLRAVAHNTAIAEADVDISHLASIRAESEN
jgi:hypothetical protein